MSIKVTIEKTVEEFWGIDEDLALMSDKALVELFQEDTVALLDGATWTIIRS